MSVCVLSSFKLIRSESFISQENIDKRLIITAVFLEDSSHNTALTLYIETDIWVHTRHRIYEEKQIVSEVIIVFDSCYFNTFVKMIMDGCMTWFLFELPYLLQCLEFPCNTSFPIMYRNSYDWCGCIHTCKALMFVFEWKQWSSNFN